MASLARFADHATGWQVLVQEIAEIEELIVDARKPSDPHLVVTSPAAVHPPGEAPAVEGPHGRQRLLTTTGTAECRSTAAWPVRQGAHPASTPHDGAATVPLSCPPKRVVATSASP
jgi:hypothetical protein